MWVIAKGVGDLPFRTNQGQVVITNREHKEDESYRVLVDSVTKPRKGQGWNHEDPASLALAEQICQHLNKVKA